MSGVKAEVAANPEEPEKVAAVANAVDLAGKTSLSALVVAAEKAVAAGGDDDKESLAALERLRGFKVRISAREREEKKSVKARSRRLTPFSHPLSLPTLPLPNRSPPRSSSTRGQASASAPCPRRALPRAQRWPRRRSASSRSGRRPSWEAETEPEPDPAATPAAALRRPLPPPETKSAPRKRRKSRRRRKERKERPAPLLPHLEKK